MKIRYIAGIYTIIMLFVLVLFAKEMQEKTNKTVDMVSINEKVKTIEQHLTTGKDKHSVETAMECEVLLISEKDYESNLNQALQERKLVMDYQTPKGIQGKIIFDLEGGEYEEARQKLFQRSVALCLTISVLVYILLATVYLSFVRPFHTLQRFSAQVAKGNLEISLPMNRHNFFGAFTESFDMMREELKRARESEYAANISKKELVAELSHDIKTPIATIKAVCEVLQVTEKKEDTLNKINVIEAKAEMIDNLIGNMFHATLEELEVLKTEPEEESSLMVEEMIQELKYYGEIIFENRMPECLLYFDKLRLKQVIDNIINNAYKYAKTAVYVSFLEEEDGVQIRIKDKGSGVVEDELSLVTEKFYRGSNTKGKSGSGLGLYLAKNFMEGMEGGMECYNQEGFVVNLFLKKV